MSTHAAAPTPMTAEAGVRPRPTYTRLAASGLGLVALAPAIVLVSAIASGMEIGEDAPFFIALLAVPTVGAVLAWRFGTWSKIVGIVLTLLAATGMWWMAFGLTHPTSFGDFTPGVSFVVGAVAGIGGSIAAIVAGRRGNTSTELEGRERSLVLGAAGLVAVAAVVSLALGLATGSSVAAADAEGATAVGMHNFEFADATSTVASGDGAKLLVTNRDAFVHDIAVPQLGIEAIVVKPGNEILVDLSNAAPGTYTMYCTLHSDTSESDPEDAGMAATLIVE